MRWIALVLTLAACGDDDSGHGHSDAAPTDVLGDGARPALFADPPLHLALTQAIPHALAVRDLDANGTDDLVVGVSPTAAGGDTVLVQSGKTDRTFTSTGYMTAEGAYRLIFADVDGSGVLDLVQGSVGTGHVIVLPGVANGTFGAAITTTVMGATQTQVLGTFDADANIDIVTGRHTSTANAIGFAPGSGDGTFGTTTAVTLGSPIDADHLVAGDFDKDGKLDVAVDDFLDDTVLILKGAGNGTFTEVSRFTVQNASDFRAADMTGDATLDLVVLSAGKVNVAIGNGDGTFAAPLPYSAKTSGLRIEVADVNGDGKLDAIASDTISELFHVLLGNGDGTLQPPVSFAGDNFEDFAVGDFDGDSHPDLAMAISAPTAEVVVYFGAP